MKKAELEKEILDLKLKVAALEARPQTFYCGHVCTCNHFNYPNPNYPWYGPNISCGTTTDTGGGSATSGFVTIIN